MTTQHPVINHSEISSVVADAQKQGRSYKRYRLEPTKFLVELFILVIGRDVYLETLFVDLNHRMESHIFSKKYALDAVPIEWTIEVVTPEMQADGFYHTSINPHNYIITKAKKNRLRRKRRKHGYTVM
jgi:hypothetical protein